MPTNKQIIQGAYQAFAEGDVPKVLAVMDDKIEWTEAEGFPLHGTYIGPQAVVDGVFMRTSDIGDDFAVIPTRFVAKTTPWSRRAPTRGSIARRASQQWCRWRTSGRFVMARPSRCSSTSIRSKCRRCLPERTLLSLSVCPGPVSAGYLCTPARGDAFGSPNVLVAYSVPGGSHPIASRWFRRWA